MNPTEAQEGQTLVAYMRLRGFRFTHISNETGSGRIAQLQGIRNKQQGTSKGFPDYLVIADDTLIAIELKRVKGSRIAPEQLEWLKALDRASVKSFISRGAQEAIDFFEENYPRQVVEF